ncbi:hypothetical protein KP509_01G031000 [Ceratopteris richardii]|uniref:Uncharacterized protein n=1 Tax=Ceratopteris richardii TaxID=49495 RepID=A0A8T2VNG0_CERRI|nr:hypothetical protein KP509_01G031000 [Ceratopteris richardii]
MDAELGNRVISLVGHLYAIRPEYENDYFQLKKSEDSNGDFFENFENGASTSHASTSGTFNKTGAVYLSYACLIGGYGESLVPFEPLLEFSRNQQNKNSLPCLIVEYPHYYSTHNPLVFQVEMALWREGCEVCILKPSSHLSSHLPFGIRHLRMRLTEGLNEVDTDERLYCVFLLQESDFPVIIQGTVILGPNMSYGLIGSFGFALSQMQGIVTDARGRLIGVHGCTFVIEEGDTVDLAHDPSHLVSSTESIIIQERGDSHPSSLSSENFEGMSFQVMKYLQDRFKATSPKRKQKAQLCRIYTLDQMLDELRFSKKRLFVDVDG